MSSATRGGASLVRESLGRLAWKARYGDSLMGHRLTKIVLFEFAVGLLLLLLGRQLSSTPPTFLGLSIGTIPPKFIGTNAGTYLIGLADAILIAAILTGTFEYITRGIILSDFKDARSTLTWQVLRVVRQTYQEDLVLSAAEQQIIAKPFVRNPMKYFISLEPVGDKPDFVKLVYETEYSIKNLSAAPATCQVIRELSIENEDEFPNSTKIIKVSGKLGMEQKIDYRGPGIRDKPNLVYYAATVEILADQTLEISTMSEQVRSARDREAFTLSMPTLRTELRVTRRVPLDVWVFTTTGETATPIDRVGGITEWELPDVFLTGQGFELSWKPHRQA